MKINLISGPRNISTAMMYSFGQRKDTTVVDEPFYAYYLHQSGAQHPGREEILKSMSCELTAIINQFVDRPSEKPVVFIKNMAHHLVMDDFSFLTKMSNLFLIRDPAKLIISFSKVIPNPTMRDIGLEKEWQLFQWIEENTGKKPLVLDSGQILKDPEKALRILCVALDIPFDLAMLSWQAGGRSEDGVWAKYWYKNVHLSTGFAPSTHSSDRVPLHCKELLDKALPYYQKLLEHSIRI